MARLKEQKFFLHHFEMKNIDDFMLWIKRLITQPFAFENLFFVVNYHYCYNKFYVNLSFFLFWTFNKFN